MQDFFKGLKVVELANVLAGPSVGMFFAELGAEVIKIENSRTAGDMSRHWKLSSESAEDSVSAYFSSVNYMKQHLFKDLTVEKELTEVKELISSSDVVISNFKPSFEERMELDAKTLCDAHPKLIHAHLSGFARESQMTAFDVVLQAETGFLSMCGTVAGELCKIPVAMIDVIAGHQLKEGILLALLHKAQTGKGSKVSTSLEECALTCLINQASNFLMEGKVARPLGTLHPNIAPYGEQVRSSDNVQFVLAVGTDVQFSRLCQFLSREDLLKNNLFSSNQLRVVNRVALLAELEAEFSKQSSDVVAEQCKALQVPIGRIRNIAEVLASPVAKDMIRREEIEGKQTARISSIAFDLR